MTNQEDYDNWHAKIGKNRVLSEPSDPWHLLVLKHARMDKDIQVKTLLEIGCGRGGFACWLANQVERPKEVIASDFSKEALKIGESQSKELGLQGIKWIQGDIQDIPLESNSIDSVLSFETIEHVPKPQIAIKEMARVLKPGGRLFLTTPNYFGVYGLYRAYLRMTGRRYSELGQPINNFTMTWSTLAWVRDSGLRVEVVDGIGHYFLFPGLKPKRIFCLDRFRVLTKWTALHSCIVAVKS